MTAPTPPAVSDALREAVAWWLDQFFNLRPGVAKRLAGYFCAPSGPIASEIARLTGERDEIREAFMRVAEAIGAPASERLDLEVMGRLRAAEAETARLRAEREGLQAIVLADDAKALAEYEWERANKLADDNLRLVREVAQLREALEFYAEPEDWAGHPWKLYFDSPNRDGDGWEVARAALSSQEQADV